MENLDQLLIEAENFYNQLQYEKSLAFCEQALLLEADNETACFLAALNYYALNDLQQALPYFRKSTEMIKERPETWEYYAFTLSLNNHVEEALNELEGIMRSFPDYNNVLYNYGYTLAGQGKYEAAITWFNKAAKAGDDSVKLFLFRGICYYNLKRMGAAQIDLLKVEERDEENAESAFLLGEINFSFQRYAKAIKYYSKALYLKPDHHKALTQRLIARVNNKDAQGNIFDREAAQEDADRIIKENIPFTEVKDKEGKPLKIVKIEIAENGNIDLLTRPAEE